MTNPVVDIEALLLADDGSQPGPSRVPVGTPSGTLSPGLTPTGTTPTGTTPTGPSALPSSAWLQWESGAVAPLDISAHLPEGALALRRQKNRESMRRARQRQRDQLQALRDAVAGLERQYARLSAQAQEARAASSSAASRAIEDARELARRLGAENLLLRATLQDQQGWKLEMRRVFETTGYLLGAGVEQAAAAFADDADARPLALPPATVRTGSSPTSRSGAAYSSHGPGPSLADARAPLRDRLEVLSAFEAESVFGFRPVSPRDVKDLILENARAVAGVQSLLLGADVGAGAGASPAASPSPIASDETDGAVSPSRAPSSPALSSPSRASSSPSQASSSPASSSQPAVGRLNLEDDPNALHMEVFGWDVRQLVRGPEMLFCFTKRFPASLDVAAVMQRAWESEMSLAGVQKVKYDAIALAPLQVVDEHAVVLGRDVRSPDEKPLFRSTMLRFRLETARAVRRDAAAGDESGPPLAGAGFLIGTQTLNPHKHAGAVLAPDMATLYRGRAEDGRADETPTGSRLVWAELQHSVELLRVADPRDGGPQDGDRHGHGNGDGDGPAPRFVLVRCAGKTNYGSPFDARRSTSDTLSALLHWELQNIAPAVQFLDGVE